VTGLKDSSKVTKPQNLALSAYVKVKKDGTEEIVNWLLSKYSKEQYEPFFCNRS